MAKMPKGSSLIHNPSISTITKYKTLLFCCFVATLLAQLVPFITFPFMKLRNVEDFKEFCCGSKEKPNIKPAL